MRQLSRLRSKRSAVLALILLTGCIPVLVHPNAALALSVSLQPGVNLTTAISSHPAGTTFNLACGTYRFPSNNSNHQPLAPLAGDQFIGAGTINGIPSSEPCVHLTGAIRIPTDSPDHAWHASGNLWYNTVGSANVVVPSMQAFQGTCFIGPHTCSTVSVPGGCSYPQDLFFNSIIKPRLTAGDDGSVDQWPPTPGFWYFDITGKHGPANTVWVADAPTSATVEMSAMALAFTGPNDNVVIQNITLEKFAPSYGSGAIWGYGDNWQILNNWIEHNHYNGVSANGTNGSPPNNWLVKYNEFYQNGNGGMGGPTINSMWQNNQLDQNGEVSYCIDSGQKVEGTNPTVMGNTVNYTNGIGLWFDDGTQNGTMSGNTVTGSIGEGIRCEISHYCKFTGNTLLDNEQFSNKLCIAAHVPMPAGVDCCTGYMQGNCGTACNSNSAAPNEISLAQSDNSTVGGSLANGNHMTSNCGAVGISTGTRDTVPNTGNSVSYNSIIYTGSTAQVPHPIGYNVGSGGVTPPANTFDHNTYTFNDSGSSSSAKNWHANGTSYNFNGWWQMNQDIHSTANP